MTTAKSDHPATTTNNLTTITTDRQRFIDDVVKVLEDAIYEAEDKSITSCVVVLANENTTMTKSCHLDRLRLAGALAHAQGHLFES